MAVRTLTGEDANDQTCDPRDWAGDGAYLRGLLLQRRDDSL